MRFRKTKLVADRSVRAPAVAGSFYPGLPNTLSGQVEEFIHNADPKTTPGKLVGLIAPHAGYSYSGHVAGHAYRQLAGKSFDTVILIGLSHRYSVRGAAIYAHGMFRTPLGDMEINEELATRIMELNDNVTHLPAAHEGEHSLEVQLPFLQHSLLGARIVPILLQDDSPENVDRLSESIAQAIGEKSVFIVGSTDLCHYPVYEEAVQSDRVVIETMSRFDADALRDRMAEYLETHQAANLHCMMCSTGAVYTTMEVVKQIGGSRIEILKAANSGDVPAGQRGQVVGYVAAAMYADE